MIDAVRAAISKLNDEERDIIECLYFNDETVCLLPKIDKKRSRPQRAASSIFS